MGQNSVYCCSPVPYGVYGNEDQCMTAGSGGGYFVEMDVTQPP